MSDLYICPSTGEPYTCQIHMDESVIDRNGQCSTCLDDEHEAELLFQYKVYTR